MNSTSTSNKKESNEQLPQEKKFDLYKQIKGNMKKQIESCKDPITEQSYYCFDCKVATCPKCSFEEHKSHNTICKYPYYQFDNKIIEEHYKDLDNIFNLNPEYLNVDKVRGEMKIMVDSEIKALITHLEKVKENKLQEIDKLFEGSEPCVNSLKKSVTKSKKNIQDFFSKEKSFFNIESNLNPISEEEKNKEEDLKKNLDANAKDMSDINNDYNNMAFLLSYDLLNTSSIKNKQIKSTLSTIKDACQNYQDEFKAKISEVSKQIETLKEPTKEKLNYQNLTANYYKEIEDKIIRYIAQIKTIQQNVYDTVSRTGQYDDIDKKNFMFELKQKQNISNILNSAANETKDNKDLNTSISENGTGKLRSSNKIRRFDTARRSYLSNFSDAKGISPFNRPKVELSSPNEVKLGSTSVQKYFTYLTMDLINKYFRPEKQNIDKPPSFDDLDEEDIARPIPGTNEMQIYDKKKGVITKKKVPMDKAKLKYNYFLTGCRSVVIKDRVYITGGVDRERNQSKASFVYYLKTNEIKPMPDMIKTHAYHSIEFLEYYKSILVIGGENTSSCELYDMYSGKWRSLPDLNFPRANTCVYLDKMTHMLYCFFGIIGNMSTADTFSDVIECIELKKANLGWGKVEYKNKAEMDFKFGLCRIFPLDADRLLIYGASGVRETSKKGAIFLLNKNEIVKIDSKLINEMRMKAQKSKKLTKIISTFL